MKKVLITLLLMITALNLQVVSADMGPKPSVTITVEGVDVEYSFEVLKKDSDCEGFNFNIEDDPSIDEYYYGETFPEVLYDYEYDGYCSFELLGSPNGMWEIDEDMYELYYYPPKTFRFVIVTEDNHIIVSEAMTRTLFDSNVTWDLTGVSLDEDQVDVGTLTGDVCFGENDDCHNFAIGWETTYKTIIRVVLTVVIELGILFLFAYRNKKDYRFVAIVNVITQFILTWFVIYVGFYSGALGAIAILFLGETFVFLLETVLYMIYLKEHSKVRAFFYAWIANAVTLFFGLIFNILI